MATVALFKDTNMVTVTSRVNYLKAKLLKAKLIRWLSFFSYDYLRIRNDKGFTYGKYCGVESSKIVLVTGSRASFHFHSDYSVQSKGFRLYLSIVSLGKCNNKEPLISQLSI